MPQDHWLLGQTTKLPRIMTNLAPSGVGMNSIIPTLQSADTFPQAPFHCACAPRRCGGGKVTAGWGQLPIGSEESSVAAWLFCRAVDSLGPAFTYRSLAPNSVPPLTNFQIPCDRSTGRDCSYPYSFQRRPFDRTAVPAGQTVHRSYC